MFLLDISIFKNFIPTISKQFEANAVDLPKGTKKTLVMREISGNLVKKLLSNKESFAACDIDVFVHKIYFQVMFLFYLFVKSSLMRMYVIFIS
ncbi:hypothetical protein KSP40_PGU000303 [Platanthera guangdongensis]|uniref:Uncharacterized protein n=1 Tax=Platanthera guangdongensis TaxID=2320717 RepID=A0ABR2MVQ7_9ASPA